ncbi:MAG: hypothetical protein ACK4J0_02420 [Candidatus Anstonellaceae archaeon]
MQHLIKNHKSNIFSYFKSVSSIFKKHKPESDQIENKKNNRIQLLALYMSFRFNELNNVDVYYKKAFNLVNQIKPNSNEIEEFSKQLNLFESDPFFKIKAGLFLSALINSSEYQHFKIFTNSFQSKIHFLGFQNTKNIEIFGDSGNNLGYKMQNGTIVVHGNTGDNIGFLMQGGKIYLKGNYKSIYAYLLGEVYLNEELIFKNGKKIKSSKF